MSKKISFVLDDDVVVKLRNIQAEMIQKEARIVSFSEVVNLVLQKGLKK